MPYLLFTLFSPRFDFSVLAKRLDGKCISYMTYLTNQSTYYSYNNKQLHTIILINLSQPNIFTKQTKSSCTEQSYITNDELCNACWLETRDSNTHQITNESTAAYVFIHQQKMSKNYCCNHYFLISVNWHSQLPSHFVRAVFRKHFRVSANFNRQLVLCPVLSACNYT